MNPLTQSKKPIILPVLIALTLGCFALSPTARAVCQEGCLSINNTVLGEDALINHTGNAGNTAVGFNALFSNTIGTSNTAVGDGALSSGDTDYRTAVGSHSGSGYSSTALGANALTQDTGSYNTAVGRSALGANTSGAQNTATGANALHNHSTGDNNTAAGFNALYFNSAGTDNSAFGYSAGENTTGSNNIAIGSAAGVNVLNGSNNIHIGNSAVSGDASTIRIGTRGTQTKTFIAGISGVTVPGGVAVIVGTNGKLGTTTSSARFKEAIKPMDKASEAILALKSVNFRYKHDLDPDAIPQFGLVAEDVEKVNPDLVARGADGKAYTVRYEAVNAMLLNEFLKEHRKVEKLEATVASLAATVKEQAAQIQRVSAHLELSKPVLQTIANNQ
jgi:hypothetical protein